MRGLVLALVLSLPAMAQEKWPARFRTPPPEMVALADQEGLAAWETSHFVLVCEEKIATARMKEFAQVMESVPRLFRSLSIPLWAPPKGEKAVIRICKDEASFVAAGGPPGAAGYYHGRQALVLVRGDVLLNPPQGKATQLAVPPDGDLLVHELCHLAMHQHGSLPPWLGEGIAEYFSSCHLGKGSYDFSDSRRRIPQHIQKFYPVERYPILQLPSLNEVIALQSREWVKGNDQAEPEDRYRPYAVSLLLAHYYLEGGEERRAELGAYFQETLSNRSRENRNFLPTAPEGLEDKLVGFWKTKGLHLQFAK